MIVTEHLIFLQLMKTGSSHIAILLQNLISGERIAKHNRLPADFPVEGKYIVGSVRNPWDWYVSLWAFGCAGKGNLSQRVRVRKLQGHSIKSNPSRGIFSAFNEILKPVSVWQRVYADHTDPQLFREWLHLVLNPIRKYDLGQGYGFSPISSFVGFLTYSYLRLFTRDISLLYSRKYLTNLEQVRQFDQQNNLLQGVIRNEFLEDDLIRVLDEAGYKLSNHQRELIKSSGKSNASVRDIELGYYYDRETVELVAKKEEFIINKYGYKPPEFQLSWYKNNDQIISK
ncbi:MAG: hypothetical protein D6756_07500 [Cyanobacteria bacterium J083]|nr:MAG: hypothetical protein D6756_07500 [Cyanobacteria bacterium J083]